MIDRRYRSAARAVVAVAMLCEIAAASAQDAQSAAIENGFVFLPREAPWLADYLRELTLFPAGRHDDQVDSTAQALAWMKRRPREPGWLTHWRREAEEGAAFGWGR